MATYYRTEKLSNVGLKEKSIYVYELVDTAQMMEQSKLLANIFFDSGKRSGNAFRFSISPLSGWMSFYNYDKLWKTIRPMPFPDLESVQQIAAGYIKAKSEIIRQMSDKGQLNELGLQNFFPAQPKRENFLPVFHPNSPCIDHLIYQFGIDLTSGSLDPKNLDSSVPVLGSLFEFRIDNKGEIIGYFFKHRPYNDKKQVDLVGPPAPKSESNVNNSQTSQNDNPVTLVYLLDDQGAPQNYLCPYYLTMSDDEGNLEPASSLSMSVEIVQTNFGDLSLRGTVKGGGGSYEFHWYRWDPENVFDLYMSRKFNIELDGQTGIPTDDEIAGGILSVSIISLPPGYHNLILTVKDTSSGIVKQTQSNIYCYGR